MLRLWNSSNQEKVAKVKLHLYGVEKEITMRPCGVYTYWVESDGTLSETDPVMA